MLLRPLLHFGMYQVTGYHESVTIFTTGHQVTCASLVGQIPFLSYLCSTPNLILISLHVWHAGLELYRVQTHHEADVSLR